MYTNVTFVSFLANYGVTLLLFPAVLYVDMYVYVCMYILYHVNDLVIEMVLTLGSSKLQFLGFRFRFCDVTLISKSIECINIAGFISLV